MRKQSTERSRLLDTFFLQSTRRKLVQSTRGFSKSTLELPPSSYLNFLRFGSPTGIIVHIPKHIGVLKSSNMTSARIEDLIDFEATKAFQVKETKPFLTRETSNIPISSFSELRAKRKDFSIKELHKDTGSEHAKSIRKQLFSEYLDIKPRITSQPYFGDKALNFIRSVKEGNFMEVYNQLSFSKQLATSTDIQGNSPLHYAAIDNNCDIAKILLVFGASPNVKNLLRQTPVFIAVQKELLEMTKLLLRAGGDIHIENNNGESPYIIARENQMLSLISGA